MKRFFVIMMPVLITVLGPGIKRARAKDDSPFMLSTEISSQYMGDNGAVFHNQPVLQTELSIAFPKFEGGYFKLRQSMGLDGTGLSSDYGDELDYTLGWTGKKRGIDLDVGVAYLDLWDLLKGPKGDMLLVYLELSKELKFQIPLTVYVKIEDFLSPTGDRSWQGVWYRVGINQYVNIIDDSVFFEHDLYLLADDGAFEAESGIVCGYQSRLGWNISNDLTVDISAKMVFPLSSFDDRKFEVVPALGATYRF